MKPVTINFKDLKDGLNSKILLPKIKLAFDENSLGLILIKNPPQLTELREALIKSGREFERLKDKDKYEVKEAFYAVGWSYGKEKMKNSLPDFSKGSYYANPLTDEPTYDEKLIDKYPGSYYPNVWPKEVPEFKKNFKLLGYKIYNIGLMLLNHCDTYLNSIGYQSELELLMFESQTCKGRFLHYYPSNPELNNEDDGLCGWHCDSGGLTGLISAMYFDKNGDKMDKPKDCGLQIKDRNNNLIKVDIPENCVAFQIGEIIQILSHGKLIATPHCVKSSKKTFITRNTLAVFMDTSPTYSIEIKDDNIKEIISIKNLPKGVPKMEDRFYNGITYGEFLDKTYRAYYG